MIRAICLLAMVSAVAGCSGNAAPTAVTETVTVTAAPSLFAAPAPIELPPGSVLHDRGVDDYTGAWRDIWYLPSDGPDALTEQGVIDYLQAELPGGRPFDDGTGSPPEWCRGGDDYWSWQKVGGGPDEPDAIDRLYVRLITSHVLDIQRDAKQPLSCLS